MKQRIPESLMTASAADLSGLRLNVLEGAIPSDLRGHVFIVGPVGSVASKGLPTTDGTPVLNGNGMIYRFDFDVPGEARVSSKVAQTPCYHADAAAQANPAYEALRFANKGLVRLSLSLGFRDELNTAFVPILVPGEQPRLLVTYDVGRPYEIDTFTLETVTPVGSNAEWEPALPLSWPFPMVLATAHPYFDPERREYIGVNFGRSFVNILNSSGALLPKLVAVPAAIAGLVGGAIGFIERALGIGGLALGPSIRGAVDAAGRAQGKVRKVARPVRRKTVPLTTSNEKHEPVSGEDFVFLVKWDGSGALTHYHLALPDGQPVRIDQTMHQIGVTRNWVVLADTSVKIDFESMVNNPLPDSAFLENILRTFFTGAQKPNTSLYLVRRADLTPGHQSVTVRKVEVPFEAAHLLVDYDDEGDQITLYMQCNSATDIGEWVRSYDTQPSGEASPGHLRGFLSVGQLAVNRLGRHRIDAKTGEVVLSGVYSEPHATFALGLYAYREFLPSGLPPPRLENVYWTDLGLWNELSTRFIDSLYRSYVYRNISPERLVAMRRDGGQPASLFRFNYPLMRVADRWRFPADVWASTPQFVPRAGGGGGDTDGYIVVGVAAPGGSQIWIFDAADLAKGPLCKLGHPSLSFGFTVHSAWLPTIAPRTARYNIPVRQDYEPLVARCSKTIQQFFEDEVYPHFPQR